MGNQRLYIIQGSGNDSVGLVGSITKTISNSGGNIVDLKQDVLHGLFIIYLVVDLRDSKLHFDEFNTLINQLGEDIGLNLKLEKYNPVHRNPAKQNMLMILIGKDKKGIIASVSEILASYNINIEFSENVAREGIFLMELLTDISHCSIPFGNIQTALIESMKKLEINIIFQTKDVFNKKKRFIFFDIKNSFLDDADLNEILQQTQIAKNDLKDIYNGKLGTDIIKSGLSLLEGFPVNALENLVKNMTPTSDTMELLQSLKIMGYRIVICTNAVSLFTNSLKKQLGLEYAIGIDIDINNDSQTISGSIPLEEHKKIHLNSISQTIIEKEKIIAEDITVISDNNFSNTPGIHLKLNLEKLLNQFNDHVISRENMQGILGLFGSPNIV